MATNKIDSVTTTNLSSVNYSDMPQSENSIYKDFWKVTLRDTDGAGAGDETTFTPDWKRWHSYYKEVSIFASRIDKFTSFTIGKGYKAKTEVMSQLDQFRGWGKDDFNSILENQTKVALTCGDSFAEQIRLKTTKEKIKNVGNKIFPALIKYSPGSGKLINLKPLNPGMKIVIYQNGMLKGYKQTKANGEEEFFQPNEIFHLCWNRTANEMHGTPLAERMESTIKMIMEVKNDQRVMFHRYIVPVTMIPVKSDDPTEIAGFKAKYATAYTKVEPMMVPEDVVDTDKIKHISIPQFSVHDPMPWLRDLKEGFAEDIGVANFTGEKITEASAKIIYLAFQQTIERSQRWLEANVKAQLGFEINLEFPASIAPELMQDTKKDGPLNKKPNVDPMKHE